MDTRYRALSPSPRLQSLAKTIDWESPSQAGDSLLQLPDVKRREVIEAKSSIHMCRPPVAEQV